jgi:hypothetical protein
VLEKVEVGTALPARAWATLSATAT